MMPNTIKKAELKFCQAQVKLSSLVKIYASTGGWVGGWEEKWRLKLTSAEVEAEFGNKLNFKSLLRMKLSLW